MNIMLDEGAFVPTRAHYTDAGLDLKTPRAAYLFPHSSVTIDTGVHFEIPEGYWGKIESKSGLNINHSVVSLGGTIDSGYTGSVKVKLYNLSSEPYEFKRGDKIAQLVITPCVLDDCKEVDAFAETERGDNGFGSTGR